MAKKRKRRSLGKAGCTTVIFKRDKKGGKKLPKSKWKRVTFCR